MLVLRCLEFLLLLNVIPHVSAVTVAKTRQDLQKSQLVVKADSEQGSLGLAGEERLADSQRLALLSQQEALETVSAQQKAETEREQKLQARFSKLRALAKKQDEALKAEKEKLELNQQELSEIASVRSAANAVTSFLNSCNNAVNNARRSSLNAVLRVMRESLASAIASAVHYFIWLVIGAVINYWFWNHPYTEKPQYASETRRDIFTYGLFSGLSCDPDARVCVNGCCFWPVLWAKTSSNPKLSLLPFWPAFFIMAIVAASVHITYSATAIVLIALGIWQRQRIRRAFGLPYGTCKTYSEDCCVWTLCSLCANMQEAMQVQFAELPADAGRDQIKDPFVTKPEQRRMNLACC
eukprot:TRINITY_DN113477_c0_g1_i1.p1 TRINITY_DN113477_c0_g1~~TRINITY_DN113477_c0_g1_i1.p1  ORF type:complete len:353 (+),score=59.42 TRINITY_DN113477_c0_g1_i1:95-1153(+)